jgi:uncharacterized membrane protein
MAKDLGDAIGTALGKVAREAVGSVASNGRGKSNGALSGAKGLAAGVGMAALAPVAAKGAGKLAKGIVGNGASPVQKVGEKVGGTVKDAVGQSIEGAGGPAGIAKEGAKSMLPGVGGGGGKDKQKSKGVEGVGKGRRMPVQQDIDIGVPLEKVYKQWTEYEEWPKFMHRLQSVSEEDDSHVSFKTKIWGFSREFKAEIVEEKPKQRIKWKVNEGVTHTGVVTFHELGPRLTRVEVNIDVQPGSLIEKAARGMRHVKRAVRADLARFKAYVLMQEDESGSSEGGGQKQERRSSGRRKSSSSGRSGSRSKASSSGASRSRSASSGRSSSRSRSASSRSSGSSNGSSGSSSRRTRASSSNGSSSSRSGGSSSRGGGSSSRSGSSRSSGSSSRKKSGSRS